MSLPPNNHVGKRQCRFLILGNRVLISGNRVLILGNRVLISGNRVLISGNINSGATGIDIIRVSVS